jgi:hypothetical protein
MLVSLKDIRSNFRINPSNIKPDWAAMAPTPIIIGVGDCINRSVRVEDALEPLDLILAALRNAFDDAANGTGADQLIQRVNSVEVVLPWTWPYPDLPGLLAERLGISQNVKHKATSPHGGNQPAKLLDEAARRVAKGECDVAVVCGGEALASRKLTALGICWQRQNWWRVTVVKCAAAGKLPPPGWTHVPKDVASVFSPTTRKLGDDLGGIHSIGAPIQVYPLYENGSRVARGQSIEQNAEESARLYADFAKIAAGNPMAWTYGQPPASEDDIKTISKRNRMICSPCKYNILCRRLKLNEADPLLMNAFNNVNLAGACILTSTEMAEKLKVSPKKWIYPLGGAGTRDAYSCKFTSRAWRQIDHCSLGETKLLFQPIDIKITWCCTKSVQSHKRRHWYIWLLLVSLTLQIHPNANLGSCFPIVPKLACAHLGIPLTGGSKPLSLLGGLTSFGGAGNNYSMHAIIEMVRHLRSGSGKTGLVLANGGSVTYQHVVCLSNSPRSDGSAYPSKNPLPENLESEPHPVTDVGAEGEVEIETYTVEFERDGSPSAAYVVGRLVSNGHRVLANEADEATLNELAAKSEQIGKRGWLRRDPDTEGRGLFTFKKPQSML